MIFVGDFNVGDCELVIFIGFLNLCWVIVYMLINMCVMV